eukprot:CAMPEP_0172485874 /NCGR_PEP_ID=MMETSP1066-20121228/14127_1 /TAXON_ID=671091 /ORGANISM="Coscinodiscus wailesii, Strain CCMP2513" /LENGTH=269 /DNA_ID=CAMNT_0013251415 /DNA_START=41 /DNA_END=851 /DNA_ORIENTATION=+
MEEDSDKNKKRSKEKENHPSNLVGAQITIYRGGSSLSPSNDGDGAGDGDARSIDSDDNSSVLRARGSEKISSLFADSRQRRRDLLMKNDETLDKIISPNLESVKEGNKITREIDGLGPNFDSETTVRIGTENDAVVLAMLRDQIEEFQETSERERQEQRRQCFLGVIVIALFMAFVVTLVVYNVYVRRTNNKDAAGRIAFSPIPVSITESEKPLQIMLTRESVSNSELNMISGVCDESELLRTTQIDPVSLKLKLTPLANTVAYKQQQA